MRAIHRLGVLLLPLLLLGGTAAAAPDGEAPHVTAHDLTVRFDPPRHRLVAADTLTLQGGAEGGNLSLHLDPALELSKVTLAGSELAVSREKDGTIVLPVPAGGPHQASLHYAGKVYDAVTKADDLAWVVGDNTRGVIGDMGAYLSDASGWVPLPRPRRPAVFHVETYIPAPFVVVTQGGAVTRKAVTVRGFDPAGPAIAPTAGTAHENDTKFEHATHRGEIATDGLSLSAGPYVMRSREVDGVRLSTFFYRRHAEHADLWLDAAAETVRRYTPLLGPYPHAKFDIVENFFQSGYGMPSYTLLGDSVIGYVTAKAKRRGGKIPPGYLDHEYVHGWFGNGLFVDYPTGNWCEALTTYYSNYLARELENASEARNYRRGVLEKFAIRVKGDADYPLRKFVTKTEDTDNDVGYGKGAMFFHMLRKRVGDKAFFDGIKSFTAKRLGTIVSWDQLLFAFDKDGAALSLTPFLEHRGVPRLSLDLRQNKPLGDGRTHLIAAVDAKNEAGARWPTTVPVRVVYRTGAGESRIQNQQLEVTQRPALLDLVLDGAPVAVEIDPDFDMLRHIPAAELPHCLNRTLAAEGPGVVVVDAPAGTVQPWAQSLAKAKDFTLKDASYDWRGHAGPVVRLRVLPEIPKGGVDIGGERFADPTVSVVRSWGSDEGPRTEYVALSPKAASRAHYVPFYGWDSWVRFHNGIPRDRRTIRPPPNSTRIVLQDEGAAEKRADGWVRALSAMSRAPGQRKALLEKHLYDTLRAGLSEVEIDDTVRFVSGFTQKDAAFHYVLGSHQGKIRDKHVRAFCFSGSGTTPWLRRNALRVIAWSTKNGSARDLYKRVQRGAYQTSSGVVVVVDKATWDSLAPWLDTVDNLTEAARADLARPGRGGRPRPRPASLHTWITGRQARGGLPSPKPVNVPVLCIREEVLPQKAATQRGPLHGMDEMSLEVAVSHTWVKGRNLVAWKPASASALAPGMRPPVLLLMAHYDSLPWREGHSYRGADDNASGVACLLEVARNLGKRRGDPNLGVVFALTDAEEWGLYGARALRAALATKFDIRGVINVDSIGRATSKPCHVIGQSLHKTLAEHVTQALAHEGVEIGRDIDRYAFAFGSDHYPFHQVGIPAVSLWASDYAVMNTVADVPGKVESGGIARISRALTSLVCGDLSWLLEMK